MKKIGLVLVAIVLAIPVAGHPFPWELDQSLQIELLPPSVNSFVGGSGGLFKLTNTTVNETIYGFCLELDEWTTYAEKVYDGNTDEAIYGGRNTPPWGNDPLDGATKWLYSRYLYGIPGFDNVKALALAIWLLEEEYKSSDWTGYSDWKAWYAAKSNDLNLAQAAWDYYELASSHSNYQNENIHVLNTYNGSFGQGGTQGQSYVYGVKVPEPMTISLLGLGLVAVGLGARRLRKNA